MSEGGLGKGGLWVLVGGEGAWHPGFLMKVAGGQVFVDERRRRRPVTHRVAEGDCGEEGGLTVAMSVGGSVLCAGTPFLHFGELALRLTVCAKLLKELPVE